ncbi:MAG: hypothetical protein HYX63_01435 [Gammaproteobacteria bacterium]|nr:hypothetical protein [Gammaproteobacteria bacterium]
MSAYQNLLNFSAGLYESADQMPAAARNMLLASKLESFDDAWCEVFYEYMRTPVAYWCRDALATLIEHRAETGPAAELEILTLASDLRSRLAECLEGLVAKDWADAAPDFEPGYEYSTARDVA